MLIGPRSATILGVQAAQTTTTGELLPKESHACASRPTHAYRRARPPGDVKNRWYPAANCDAKVEWDFEDQLVKVTKADGTVVENTYDVDGVLVRTAVNGVATDLLVDTSGGLSHVVAEVDGSGAVSVLYVRAGDMLFEEVRGGVAKMYEADGLGSVRGLLDVTGARTDSYAYEAFGSTLSSTGSDANPYRFAGEHLVDSVGFYQNRARWLDTRTGRFVSVDPAEGSENAPVTFYPYVYSNQSPASYRDPSGNETLVEMTIVVGIVGSLAGCATTSLNTRGIGGGCTEITMKRKFIHLSETDQYGHWWTEVKIGDRFESYGWWPKNKFYRGQKGHNLWCTITGVEGELNGQTSFGGTPTRDPDHGKPAEEQFNPRLKTTSKYRTCTAAAVAIPEFAQRYSGEWSWPVGQNCRSFQRDMMNEIGLEKP